ncbi:universal stress protein [Catellatospora sichuanensis]|uniref:universal stress protein n=1 Tax=Catellatospora sichuanensis TaxID=1969805 RepID=UPI00118352E2|nr:universal stress protein [Catellatospora sichuanensis]
MTDLAPVVAGVDGSAQALAAVRMATREAAWRGVSLRIVHAFIWPLMHVNVGAPPSVPEGGLRHDAERALAQAADTAAATDATVAVSTDLVTGGASGVLLHAARNASLLVLGDRGLGGFSGLLLGSVAVHVTSHIETPVLVVRGDDNRTGPVVLGVDGSPGAAGAVAAAFAEADQRRCELLAVRVWHEPQTGIPPVPESYASELADERDLIDTACGSCRQRHPDVPVRQEVRAGPVARTLVDLSGQAQLVVVGARGRGGFAGLLLGSVSQQLLHHAACPVLVVRHARRAGSA